MGVMGNDEPITDNVLIDAANNPRERMHVLTLENFMLEFVKSGDRSVEMPPVSNSFRRLLIYRLAARFRIATESSQYPNEYGEKGVVAFRTPDSCIPVHLLINYKPSNGYDEYDTPVGESSSSSSTNNNGKDSSTSTKKVLVMRRVPSASDNNKKDSASQRNQQSELDKERAYAEARARIFGEGGGADSSPGMSKASSSDSLSGKSGAVSRTGSAETPTTVFNANETNNYSGQSHNDESRGSSSSSGGGRGKKPVVDAGSWKGKKAIERGEHEYDPDFVRRAPMSHQQQVYDGAAGAYYPAMPQYAPQMPVLYNAPYYPNPGYTGYPAPAQYNASMVYPPPQFMYDNPNLQPNHLEKKS